MSDAVHEECLRGVRAVVQGLTLDDVTGADPLPDERVYLRKLPTDRGLTLPCVIVSLPPLAESIESLGLGYDRVGYPVQVSIVFPANADLAVDPEEFEWRRIIRQAFNRQRPSGLTDLVTGRRVLECVVEPAPVIDVGLYQSSNLWVSALVVRVVVQEARGS